MVVKEEKLEQKGQSNFCHNCGKSGRLDIDCSSPRKQQVAWLLIARHPSSSGGEKFMKKYNLHHQQEQRYGV